MKKLSAALLAILLFGASYVQACPACYGAAHSSRIDGMNAAIMTMVGITGFVLTGISTVFYTFWKRSRMMQDIDQNSPFESKGN